MYKSKLNVKLNLLNKLSILRSTFTGIRVMTARKEIKRWKERRDWITDTVLKKDTEHIVGQSTMKKSTISNLPRLPNSFTPISQSEN